jgi:hypothetical protein
MAVTIKDVVFWDMASCSSCMNQISGFLWSVKDILGLRTPGTYRIPCECSKVYIGHTGLSMNARLKEHQWHIRLEHPDKSAVAEHSVNLGHRLIS